MNYEQKITKLSREATKSLYALLEVLGDIDENDPSNDSNEWSITDDDGNVILLGYSPKTRELTITRNGLKQVISNVKQQPKRKLRVVMKRRKP